MRDLLRLAAHIAGIALTISLIPLAAVLMVTDHLGWGAACLAAAMGAVWLAARLDHRAHQPAARRDTSWDSHCADVTRVLSEPTMRLDAAALRSTICPPQRSAEEAPRV